VLDIVVNPPAMTTFSLFPLPSSFFFMTQIHVAIAILHKNGNFLCQLRDDIPNIRYPGHWALFGGHLEPGETVEEAVLRELVGLLQLFLFSVTMSKEMLFAMFFTHNLVRMSRI
jgi:hypothetical protein